MNHICKEHINPNNQLIMASKICFDPELVVSFGHQILKKSIWDRIVLNIKFGLIEFNWSNTELLWRKDWNWQRFRYKFRLTNWIKNNRNWKIDHQDLTNWMEKSNSRMITTNYLKIEKKLSHQKLQNVEPKMQFNELKIAKTRKSKSY